MPRATRHAPIQVVCDNPLCGITFFSPPSRKSRFHSRACWRAWTCRPVEERFWTFADRTRGPDSCWIWQGGQYGDGYGHFTTNDVPPRQVRAHRFAWELTHGPIPDGLFALHDCPMGDNPLCINPAHLFLGTHQDNMDDAVHKGQTLQGIKHHKTKLTEEQVYAIRACQGVITGKETGKRFAVSPQLVSFIWHRKLWGHLPDLT